MVDRSHGGYWPDRACRCAGRPDRADGACWGYWPDGACEHSRGSDWPYRGVRANRADGGNRPRRIGRRDRPHGCGVDCGWTHGRSGAYRADGRDWCCVDRDRADRRSGSDRSHGSHRGGVQCDGSDGCARTHRADGGGGSNGPYRGGVDGDGAYGAYGGGQHGDGADGSDWTDWCGLDCHGADWPHGCSLHRYWSDRGHGSHGSDWRCLHRDRAYRAYRLDRAGWTVHLERHTTGIPDRW